MSKRALSEIFAGLVIFALGITLLLAANSIIPRERWWPYFLTSLGGVFLIDATLRSFFARERFFGGRFIIGTVLAAIGLSTLFYLRNWWPFILIVAGFLIILRGILGREPIPK